MNKFLCFVGALLFASSISILSMAQQRSCGTMQHHADLLQQHPNLQKVIEKNEAAIQSILQQNPNYRIAGGGIVTIPVVFHVVYKTAAQNIPDARLLEQLSVLNNDYAHLNADSINTPAVFASLAANTGIQFCLAQRDPNDNPTTGIIRVSTNTNSFNTNDNVKYTASGGDDAWPTTKYLNIWVANLGGGLLGYAQFPGGPAATDGVVLLYSSVGGPNAPGTIASYDLGRSASHEVGHWLNLNHIWGDANCGNDNVSDTPTQQAANFGCPSFPHVTCSNGPNGDMFMNYMDYTDDACMNMFSLGQSARMNAALNSTRAALIQSLGCVPVILQNNDAGVSSITSPSGTICSSSITPVITIRNYGTTSLTSVDINYQVDAGTVNTFNWTGSLVSNATAQVTLPVLAVPAGPHTFTASTFNPNGTTDQNLTNDQSISSFSSSAIGAALPFAEGFEAPAFPPAGWTIDNPDGSFTWQQFTTSAHSGTKSIYIENSNYNANGQIDEIQMAPVNLSAVTAPEMSFWLAYKLWTNPALSPNYSDTLEVLVSTDCGLTYSSIYRKFGVALTTTSPTWANSNFTPTASQWRKETINLNAFASSTNAIFKFRNITDYENNLYVDDINIDQTTGLYASEKNSSIKCYPNPASDLLTISINSEVKDNIDITLQNALGQMVFHSIINKQISLKTIDVSHLTSGVYTLHIQAGNLLLNQKLVLKK